ncbi:probable E3 ubiquitin-protein ligase MARCHF10 isoform X2 [Tachyglossus aculeatus]|uniref:probable E3 ubiquitin-protein ligase MARCHF10 isoform X2 n=1 Tax=Tachyglossus aculeatus TaxID=9261 RepID=UPI0018F52851|nr:probable E3 ubiquitin-protein ligase MARCHF10 isoform X2 [Tachyglossus aculeatus]
MMYEAKDRQKFVSEAQCLRDMQHKMDSEYQACLRRQEHKREHVEKNRDQLSKQDSRPSLCSSHSHERPCISGMPPSRQNTVGEVSVCEQRSADKPSGTNPESKLPAIDQISAKKKQKASMGPKKQEKIVWGPIKMTPAAQAQTLSRKKLNLGRLPASPGLQSQRWPEERCKPTSLLQATPQAAEGSEPVMRPEGTGWPSERRHSLERRHLAQSSQLDRDQETPDQISKDRNALPQAQQPLALLTAIRGAPSEANGQCLTAARTGHSWRPPPRCRAEEFPSVRGYRSGESGDPESDSPRLEEESLHFRFQQPPSAFVPKNSRRPGASVAPAETQPLDDELGSGRANSLRRSDAGYPSVRQSSLREVAPEEATGGQNPLRNPKIANGDSVAECHDATSEQEMPSFTSQVTKADTRPVSCFNVTTFPTTGSSGESRSAQERPSHGTCPRTYDGLPPGRPVAPRPLLNLAHNTLRPLPPCPPRGEVPTGVFLPSTSLQILDSDGSVRFNTRRPLSPIRSRLSSARTENQDVSGLLASSVEDDTCFREEQAENSLSSSPSFPVIPEDPVASPSSGAPPSCPPPRMDFPGPLPLAGSVQEEVPIVFTVAGLNAKEAPKTGTDPGNLKRLQESLLEENSEEEGDSCRICLMAEGSPSNPLLEPCGCVGSLQFVHRECLKTWLEAKITAGAELGAVKTCEMCKQALRVDPSHFNVLDYYRKHQQSRVQNELLNSGLYLFLLLHLCEQRFAELMRLNYSQAARERFPGHFLPSSPEENENSDSGDSEENSIYPGQSRIV